MHTHGNWWFDMNLNILNDPIGSVKIARVSGRNREEAKANAALIASAPDLLKERDQLREQVRILREALAGISGVSANENSDPDSMADALGEIQGIVRRALEATKEGV